VRCVLIGYEGPDGKATTFVSDTTSVTIPTSVYYLKKKRNQWIFDRYFWEEGNWSLGGKW
jgi:hypothetical protein